MTPPNNYHVHKSRANNRIVLVQIYWTFKLDNKTGSCFSSTFMFITANDLSFYALYITE